DSECGPQARHRAKDGGQSPRAHLLQNRGLDARGSGHVRDAAWSAPRLADAARLMAMPSGRRTLLRSVNELVRRLVSARSPVDRSHWFVADYPGVVTGWNRIGITRTQVKGGAIVHLEVPPTRQHEARVRHLAASRAHDWPPIVRPAPARLKLS